MTTLTKEHAIWRPFTQMKNAPVHNKVVKGEGPWLHLEDGRKILDMVSSWWVNVHGHSNPTIAKAIYDQAMTLEHVIFSEFTHQPAETLSEKLLEVLPDEIEHIFFSDNGSTAVEVGMKMAYQYWWNLGEKKDTFIVFDKGYHGDTIGAMSLGNSSGFFEPFNKLLFNVETVSYPAITGDANLDELEEKTLAQIRDLVENSSNSFAGILLEPLVQGAGGMRMVRPEFLSKLSSLARQLDLLIIYDEVMTGFGRVGDWFASTKSRTTPDIICLSKGITGGFLPLAATCCNSKVFQSFYSDDRNKTFYHGHSYTANPIACAAAVASLELMHENKHQFMGMEKIHQELGENLSNNPKIRNFRICGTIAAFEVATDGEDSYFNEIGPKLKSKFMESSILMRPLGNTLYLMPPFVTEKEVLEQVYSTVESVLEQL